MCISDCLKVSHTITKLSGPRHIPPGTQAGGQATGSILLLATTYSKSHKTVVIWERHKKNQI